MDFSGELSVIVPTYNRRTQLARLLAALDGSYASGSCFETIVVVDGATDGTAEMLIETELRFPLRVVEQANSGPAAARNRALALAKGELVLFMDDDVIPVPGLIERHLSYHRADANAVVIGPLNAPTGKSMPAWLEWEAATLRKQYEAMVAGRYRPTPRQFYTANASIARRHLLKVGGFDERFRRAEDVELAYRLEELGLHFYLDMAAAVEHEPDRSLEGWTRMAYEYGRHDVIAGRTRPSVLALACTEFQQRRRINRVVTRWCGGRRRSTGALTALARPYLQLGAPWFAQAVCSALFSLHYWQGIADESGLGSMLWRHLHNPLELARNRW